MSSIATRVSQRRRTACPLMMLSVAAETVEATEEQVVLSWKERALRAEATLEAINKQLRELAIF